MVQYPVDNIDVSINGTRNMLELARKKNVKGMVYLSSMEVYGQMEVSDHKISEHELGYIDLSGNLDVCIAIRTAVKINDKVSVQAGAGIVADSVPESEYMECAHKAGAVIDAIKRGNEVNK